MRRIVVGFFAAIGFLSLALVAGGVLVATRIGTTAPSLPDKIILSADLTRGFTEGESADGWRRLLFGSTPSLRDFVDALDRAGSDSRVTGIFARVGSDDIGFADAQQVRDAIAAFRAKRRFAIAFADSFGEFGAGTRPYYLASAFDQIWLQPMGALGLTGLYSEAFFLKGSFDKVGITAEFDHKGEFKTAANALTETQMTPPQREETQDLLKSISAQVVSGIAQSRKLAPSAINAAIDRAPLLAGEAVQSGLVDRLGYRDESVAAARRRAGSQAELVSLSDYLRAAGRPHDSGERIALIYGSGLIVRGAGAGGLLTQSDEMAANAVSRAFRAAVRDPKVRAIVFRIDSPGGSVVASETIWREVFFARQRGKPVIVSMGNVAGSGGYYVAAPADKIVAEPATLTGSIGVLAGKLVIADLLKKIGVSTDAVQVGANAAMFSAVSGFSPTAKARLQAFLDATYRGFKDHVAAGRQMTPEAVEAVAQGRVWTGEEAKEKGLVDALGGYEVALRLAKKAAKIPDSAAVEVTVFPREQGLAEILYDRLISRNREGGDTGLGPFRGALSTVELLLTHLRALVNDAQILLMPPFSQPR
jgi:protease IV